MQLTDAQTDTFMQQGFCLYEGVLSPERCAQVDSTLAEIYGGWQERSDGILSYCNHPGLFDLYQEPALEQIAQHILDTDRVVLNSASILHKRPQPDAKWELEGEHVDIMFSRAEWEAQPRRIICMLMVMIADLPEGRGNTYVRPGSQRLLADWLEREGREPVKAHPTAMQNLPDLPWAEPVPVVARAGDVVAFNTNLVHAGSPNRDSEARRILFVNFCPDGMLKACSGNHNRRAERTAWRDLLRQHFRPERRHLMNDSED